MNKEVSQGRKIHGQAEIAREKEQNPIKSIDLLHQAIEAYVADGDLRGATEAMQSISSAYKHMYQSTNQEIYLNMALHISLAGLEIAESLNSPEAMVMPHRGVAKIYEQLKDHTKAANHFQKAIQYFDIAPPVENNRPAVRADMVAHLSANEYLAGDKSAYNRLLGAISELETSEEEKYNKDVWLSGAHMRAASILQIDDPEKAKEHLSKAEVIINDNVELKIRKEQLEGLKKTLEI